MDTSFWFDRWQENQIGFHTGEINAHLKKYWPTFNLDPSTSILVPLCGKSADLLFFKEKGHLVTGVELSPIAFNDFFQENNLNYTEKKNDLYQLRLSDNLSFYCGDFFSFKNQHSISYDAIFDRAALVALPPHMQKKYVEHLKSFLSPGGFIFLVTFAYSPSSQEGPPFCVNEQTVTSLFKDDFKIEKIDHITI